MTRITKLFLVLWITCLAWPSINAAEPPREMKTKITIRVVYAVKDQTQSMDPRLKDIQYELRELPFSKFRLLDRLETAIPLDSTVELQFGNRQTISVSFKGVNSFKGKTMISLQIAIKPAAKITFRVADGGRTILGGPTYLEGMLFIDVSAKLKKETS